MQVVLTKQSSETVKEMRRQFDRRSIGKRFVKSLYHQGKLQDLIARNYIKTQKIQKGYLGNRLAIHHLVPLCGGGTNDFSNLMIVEKRLHRMLHKHFYDRILEQLQEGERVLIELPDLSEVNFWEAKKEKTLYMVAHKKQYPPIFIKMTFWQRCWWWMQKQSHILFSIYPKQL